MSPKYLNFTNNIINTDALSLRSKRNGTRLENTSSSTNIFQGSAYNYVICIVTYICDFTASATTSATFGSKASGMMLSSFN